MSINADGVDAMVPRVKLQDNVTQQVHLTVQMPVCALLQQHIVKVTNRGYFVQV